MSAYLCPECCQGKHGNCDGSGWDPDLDQPCYCGCTNPACQDARDAFRFDVETNL